MTVKEIKALPKEFDFLSRINPFGIVYHAVENQHNYVATVPDTGCTYSFPKSEFRRNLLDGTYVLAAR